MFTARAAHVVYDILHIRCFAILTARWGFVTWSTKGWSCATLAFWVCDVKHIMGLAFAASRGPFVAFKAETGAFATLTAFWVFEVFHSRFHAAFAARGPLVVFKTKVRSFLTLTFCRHRPHHPDEHVLEAP